MTNKPVNNTNRELWGERPRDWNSNKRALAAPSAPQSTQPDRIERCYLCSNPIGDKRYGYGSPGKAHWECYDKLYPKAPPSDYEQAMKRSDAEIARLNEQVAQEVAKVGKSTQTAREYWHVAFDTHDSRLMTKETICDFAESYASSRVASLQQELDHANQELKLIDMTLERRPALADLEHRYAKVERSCTMAGRAEHAESKLSTLTGIARELAEQCRSVINIYEADSRFSWAEFEAALEKFSDWEKTTNQKPQ